MNSHPLDLVTMFRALKGRTGRVATDRDKETVKVRITIDIDVALRDEPRPQRCTVTYLMRGSAINRGPAKLARF